MYQSIVALISTLIFDGQPELYLYGELIVEGVSAIATCLLIALPFIIVWRILRRLL